MNEIFLSLGIESWKPYLSTLLLPPVPFLFLVLVGARLMFRRRLLAWFLILLSVAGIWLSCTTAIAHLLYVGAVKPPPPLTEAQVAELKKAPRTVVVVLGGGRRVRAPEYGVSELNDRSHARLRYGVWLAKETSLPLAFSGGVGHGAEPGATEAEVAARAAERDYGRPIRWLEAASRDTHENAQKSVPLLQAQGIEQIVLVTHGYHMPRSLRNFERADATGKMRIIAAPMGVPASGRLRAVDWMPSLRGFEDTRLLLHEWVGRLMGA